MNRWEERSSERTVREKSCCCYCSLFLCLFISSLPTPCSFFSSCLLPYWRPVSRMERERERRFIPWKASVTGCINRLCLPLALIFISILSFSLFSLSLHLLILFSLSLSSSSHSLFLSPTTGVVSLFRHQKIRREWWGWGRERKGRRGNKREEEKILSTSQQEVFGRSQDPGRSQ